MAVQEQTDVETGNDGESLGMYWLGHAWLSVLVPGYIVVLFGIFIFGVVAGSTGVISLGDATEIGSAIGSGYMTVWGVGAIIAYFVAAIGYYVEAGRLKKKNVGWQPNWKVYLLAHIFLPVLVAPVYLVQRWRYVGLW